MLTTVHRCSTTCKCYADVHIWARYIRKQRGERSRLADVLKRKQECHQGTRVENRQKHQELTMPWSEVTKNINYFS
jgi:hypothetical protein